MGTAKGHGQNGHLCQSHYNFIISRTAFLHGWTRLIKVNGYNFRASHPDFFIFASHVSEVNSKKEIFALLGANSTL